MEVGVKLVGGLAVMTILCLATVAPLVWTIRRILGPIDKLAKARNAPFRFSIGDFLCLFWVVQIPLAFVFQLDTEETAIHYWVLTVMVWAVAPLVWITCARALSKAGILAGIHRYVFLGLVVPTAYYGLFPFIGLSWGGIALLTLEGISGVLRHKLEAVVWTGLALALVMSGLYTPWLVRRININSRSFHEQRTHA